MTGDGPETEPEPEPPPPTRPAVLAARSQDSRPERGGAAVTVDRLVQRLDRLLTPDRTVAYPAIILGVWLLVYVGTWLATDGNLLLPDYTSRWTGGQLILQGRGSVLYDVQAQWALQSQQLGAERLTWFVSPPYVAVLFAPLAALPYTLSTFAWSIVSLMALGSALVLLRPYAPAVMRHHRTATLLGMAASYPVFNLVAGGQDTGLVLLAVAASVRLLRGRRDFLAGVALAAGLIKPQLVFLLPLVFVIHRRPKALASFLVCGMALLGLSIAFVGTQGLLDWLDAVRSPLYSREVVQGQAWLSMGLVPLIGSFLPPTIAESLGPAAYLLCAALTAAAVWTIIRRSRPDQLYTWSLLILTTTIASPHFMVYDLVFTFAALPAIALALWHAPTRVTLALVYIALWMSPVLHLAALHLDWPASIIQAPWSVIGLAYLWLQFARVEMPSGSTGDIRGAHAEPT